MLMKNFDKNFLKKLEILLKDDKYVFKTNIRNLKIFKELVGSTIYVYNGQKYKPLKILPRMCGHNLGEFIFTRKLTKYKSKIKAKKRN